MNITGVTTFGSSVLPTTTNEDVSMAVLKKAMTADAQSTLALIDAIPAPQNLPAHLGKTINTVA